MEVSGAILGYFDIYPDLRTLQISFMPQEIFIVMSKKCTTIIFFQEFQVQSPTSTHVPTQHI
jgi:hypothetical protein